MARDADTTLMQPISRPGIVAELAPHAGESGRTRGAGAGVLDMSEEARPWTRICVTESPGQ
jgi:hypothetical protein